MANQYTAKFPERFWEKVEKTDKCWIWIGRVNKDGYGEVSYNNRVWKAHRLSYLIEHKDFNRSLYVCHNCDNPSCVNPRHLFLASQKVNMQDMSNKNRHGNQKINQSYSDWLSIRPNKGIDDECNRGHKFSYENTRIKKRGNGYARLCRECQYNTAKEDLVEYKVKSFVRGIPNRSEVVNGIIDKIRSNDIKCWYCDGPFECLDHEFPKHLGGKITIENINPSCNNCNQKRKKLYA